MTRRYHRAQILLEPTQHERMRRIAQREGRSISEVARRLIRAGLERLAADEQRRADRRADALRRLSAIREGVRERRGEYEGDLIAEARSEREADLERARRGAG